jgi:hypothetical protein
MGSDWSGPTPTDTNLRYIIPMEVSMTKRTTYSKEFKVEAVRLLERGDRKPADLARELGVTRG